MTGLREKQKAQRRSLIETAASDLFESQGFALTTIEGIAEKAMVSPATVYNYYGNKGELLLALVARGEVGVHESSAAFVKEAEHKSPEELIADIICFNVKDTLSYLSRALWGHVVAYIATTSDPEVAPRYLHTISDGLADAIKLTLAKYMELGVIRDGDPEHMAYLLTRLERNHFLVYVYLKDMTQEQLLANIAKDVELFISGFKSE